MKKAVFSALIAAIAVIVSSANSQAAFSVTVTNSGGQVLFFPGIDDSSVSGVQEFVYANGARLRIQISASSNSPGTGGIAQVTNQTVDILRGGFGSIDQETLTIVAESTGFNLGLNSGTVNTSIEATTLRGGSASGYSNINGSAVLGSLVNVTGPTLPPNNLEDSSVVNGVNLSNPFSFGNTMVISLNSASDPGVGLVQTLANIHIDSTVTVNAVPAPPALLLAAFGIPAMGLVRRWTRKVKSNEEMAIAA